MIRCLFISLFVCACQTPPAAVPHETPPSEEHATVPTHPKKQPARFDVALSQIDRGMTPDEVEAILGAADDRQTPDDHAGTWTEGTVEVWGYGTNGHMSPAKHGSIYFDAGGVQFVYGPVGRLRPTQHAMDRLAFAAALATLAEGTPEAEVRTLLGVPDDIQTQEDPGGIHTTRTREIWCYGTDAHLGFPTRGQVYIDDDGEVQYVYGGRGTPIAPTVIEEAALVPLLRLIDTAPSMNAGHTFNPLPIIQVVNALQPLGKDAALAVMSEYARLASHWRDGGREGLFLVLRVLFEVPTDTGHMPVMRVGGPNPAEPADRLALPRFPIVMADDIPLLIVGGYTLGGKPEDVTSHLEFFAAKGTLRSTLLTPTDTPWAARVAVLAKLDQAYGTPWKPRDDVEHRIINQLLRLLDSVHVTESDVYEQRFSARGAEIGPAWQAVVDAVSALHIQWAPNVQKYAFADGTTLPEPPRTRYRRRTWEVESLDQVTVTVERLDRSHIRVVVRLRATEASHPAATLHLVEASSGEVLLEMDAAGGPRQGEMVSSSTTAFAQGGALRVVRKSKGLADATSADWVP